MKDTYKTIVATSQGLYKEKGSKFIAFAYPVVTEDQIKEHIAALKEEYFDARHHCYAYSLGADKARFRMNDDGEPSSTAGKPIYGQILSNDLTDILVVVIRYFGGTKLGVPGLINAYKSATADAIANAEIVEKTVNAIFTIHFDYIVMNSVMKIVKECAPEVLDRKFENICTMVLSIRESEAEELLSRLEKVETLTLIS
ncbi:MAG: YigZ family protein [Marinifilaceae bacterium]|nr:YigZ family protein [Marinifilaceae bacterium]